MTKETEFIRVMRPEDREQLFEIYLLAHIDEYAGEKIKFPPQGVLDNPDLLRMFNLSRIVVYDDGELRGFAGSLNDRICLLYTSDAADE